jgi:putative hydrolase of the HAD superfamily
MHFCGNSVSKSSPPLWLFDLDNTLHDASHAIFPAISANMNVYIARILAAGGLPATQEAVDAARLLYWKRYGATLLGMMRHHAVLPAHFLHETHGLADLRGMMQFDRGLGRLLRRLPGRKILLTNAPTRYSTDVMHHLRLARHFDHHIAIEDMHVHRQLRPKPSTLMLRRLLRKHRAAPGRCILVEDTLENLRGAKRLGVRTVWITQYLRGVRAVKRPGYVDVKVKSVRQLGTRLRALGAVS